MNRISAVVVRRALVMALAVGCIFLAAQIGSLMAVKQITAALRRKAEPAGPRPLVVTSDVIEIDLCQATGIKPDILKAYLKDAQILEGRDAPHVAITLQDGRGEYLHEGDVIVRWDAGEQAMRIGRSAVLNLPLRKEMLSGLRIVVPPRFTNIKQMSIPSGTAYEPEMKANGSALDYQIVSDREIQIRLRRSLAKMLQDGEVLATDQLRQQLRRATTSFRLTNTERPLEMTIPKIYAERRESVVVIGHLFPSGEIIRAGGVVVSTDGVIATAFHVINKPTANARAVMMLDGRTFPIREVLAADQPNDVALVKIDAENLRPTPVSSGDAVGTAVAVMGHSGSQHYLLTEGRVARYASVQSYGRNAIQMAITADFADGGSGGPVFNTRGELTGIVSATNALGTQMVLRLAAPAVAIRALVGEPLPDTVPLNID